MATSIDQTNSLGVYVERGDKRAFASAADWPGWCRAGKDEEKALDALARYSDRYAGVAREAGTTFPETRPLTFDVLERLPGTATTEFGAPASAASRESDPLPPAETDRLASLLEATWTVFDRVVAEAPAELRKGPRGGGRDRDRVVEHVLGAEVMYARKLGLRQRQPLVGNTAAIANVRDEILRALRAASGPPPADWQWLPRYAVRRIAWHVLDHAWEIEDRSG